MEDAECGSEGKLVPYARLEAKQEFTERNGGLDEGGITDAEMLKVSMENDNLSKLIEQGGRQSCRCGEVRAKTRL